MPVLDTSFLVDLEKRRPAALEAYEAMLAEGDPLLVPAEVALEFATGLQDEVAALHHIEGAFVLVPFGRVQILEAAKLARATLRAGRFPGWADVQVASLAVLESTYVVSSNKRHFEALGVPCWDPRAEPDPPSL